MKKKTLKLFHSTQVRTFQFYSWHVLNNSFLIMINIFQLFPRHGFNVDHLLGDIELVNEPNDSTILCGEHFLVKTAKQFKRLTICYDSTWLNGNGDNTSLANPSLRK